jgi:hypothetical protein
MHIYISSTYRSALLGCRVLKHQVARSFVGVLERVVMHLNTLYIHNSLSRHYQEASY